MAFEAGKSGNPEGRVKGSKNRKTVIREALQKRGAGNTPYERRVDYLTSLIFGSDNQKSVGAWSELRLLVNSIREGKANA